MVKKLKKFNCHRMVWTKIWFNVMSKIIILFFWYANRKVRHQGLTVASQQGWHHKEHPSSTANLRNNINKKWKKCTKVGGLSQNPQSRNKKESRKTNKKWLRKSIVRQPISVSSKIYRKRSRHLCNVFFIYTRKCNMLEF